jgi:hypothetical protein
MLSASEAEPTAAGEVDEDHPIDSIEAEPLRRGALQGNDLLTQGQVLGFE